MILHVESSDTSMVTDGKPHESRGAGSQDIGVAACTQGGSDEFEGFSSELS